ncbi:hypothetical protein CC80DRAFT_513463 [Byssothecium circinans]|uniref:Zn(2)-C6 fungal-type domain-containing protein n=1 Tax=Byssothecium circinans TaxID=147558 RepID=A0A6A5U8J4_9PLEO|nr:hypothetical protein CC80DRAFT_513463 [Byssothecium circinans]
MNATQKERKRAKHTRSKAGCLVCRIRRVKCDQTRPACMKCSSTGRTCEGYPARAPASISSSHMLRPRNLPISSAMGGDPLEERSFSYFKVRTIPQFSAPFGSEFWSRLILQFSVREPSVRHALIALGALHEAFEVGTSSKESCGLSMSTFANTYYGKALSVLNAYISNNSWEGLLVSLTCCIMCVGFEWLRGRLAAALSHLRAGLRILGQWSLGQLEGSSHRVGASPSSPNGHLIRSHIAPILMRLALQARTTVDDLPPIPWHQVAMNTTPGTEEVPSVYDARRALDLLLCDVYLRSETVLIPPRHFGPYMLSKTCRDTFCIRLSDWKKMYSGYLCEGWEADGESEVPQQERVSLTIFYITLIIILATSQTKSQMTYDAFLPQFKDLVRLVRLLLSHDNIIIPTGPASKSTRSEPSPSTRFRIDMDTLPMLYFTATKCRHPRVRREAISLLRAGSSREGLWDGRAEARLAEEFMLIEEEGIWEVVDESSIPAANRVWLMDEELDLDNKTWKMRFARQDEEEMGDWRILRW